ncbi:MAG TPA: ribosome maturation factor RimM [Gammaproteobacteria bacterium]|nr:ribosome maturation factor RimM [Gammaproteobacteria bacterium]
MIDNCSGNLPEALVTLGSISGVYGVKGWVKVYSYTSPIENILDFETWQLSKNNQNQSVTLECGKKHGKGIIAKLANFDDRDEVASLLRSEIKVSRELLPALSPDEYYWRDLQGMRVMNLANVDFGKVDHLFETGANDVLVVRGDRERLIPFVQKIYIKHVDLAQGQILVDWPEDFE